MSSKPTYVDVMRFLANYASNNLSMELWRGEKENKVLADVAAQNEAAFDQLATMRTKEHLGGDELDVIEIIMDVEEEYQVELSDEWCGLHKDDPTMGEIAQAVVSLRS